MKQKLKKYLFWLLFWVFMGVWGILIPFAQVNAAPAAPNFNENIVSHLDTWVFDNGAVDKDNTFKENVRALFYPNTSDSESMNRIYNVVRDITLWIMIIFLVYSWASLLFSSNKDKKEMMKLLWNIVYMLLWGCFILWANWIFWSILKFDEEDFTAAWNWISWATTAFADTLMWQILMTMRAFAFFLAIVMLIITWIRVIWAWENEKWKKLIKWILNVVLALIIIKGIDFIFYMVSNSWTFVTNAIDFIKKFAMIFARIYWIVILLMVIVAWYLYLTAWSSEGSFKKATNILINILLSWLVLFSFLFIIYQIFSEFSTWEHVALMMQSINKISALG